MNIKDLLKDAYKDGMTVEEIDAALAEIELPADQSAEVERLKNALSKSNSENAEWKKKHRETLTAEQQKEQERQELIDRLTKQNEELLKETSVSKHKAKLLAMGYAEDLATDVAKAMVEGDMDKVFASQQKHLEAFERKIRADALKGTTPPVPDKGDSAMTLEKYKKMSPQERYEFSQKNPDEYKTLYGGN